MRLFHSGQCHKVNGMICCFPGKSGVLVEVKTVAKTAKYFPIRGLSLDAYFSSIAIKTDSSGYFSNTSWRICSLAR